MRKLTNKGFGAVEFIIILVVITAVVGAGYFVYQRTQNKKTSSSGSSTTTQTADSAPAVKSADDLKKTDDYLNNTNIDKQLDTSQLDSTLN